MKSISFSDMITFAFLYKLNASVFIIILPIFYEIYKDKNPNEISRFINQKLKIMKY